MLPFLLIYLALVYIRPHEYVEAVQGVPIVMTVLILSFLAWLFQREKDFRASHYGLLAGLMVVLPVSVAINGWVGGAPQAAIDFLPIVVLFTITAASRLTPAHYRKIFFVIGAASTVLAVHGIDQVETGIGWSGAKVIQGRITYLGFLNDPNDLGMAFLVALPMTLYWGLTGSRWARLLSLAAAAIQLVGIYLTNSRGALVAIGVMASVYAVRRFGFGRSFAVIPVLLALVVVLAPSRISVISAEEESAAGRVDSWYEGFQMFLHHPLMGVGKGNYTDHHALVAHNSFVHTFAELGFVGYFFWLSLLLVSVAMLRQVIKLPVAGKDGDPRAAVEALRQVGFTLVYSMLGYMVSALFLSRSYVFLLFFLQALIVALYLGARRQWPDEVPKVQASRMLPLLIGVELGSIVFMYLLTKILL